MEDFQKQADLSENSTHLHPTLLSESYAKLLVKQGKKQKAKEIQVKGEKTKTRRLNRINPIKDTSSSSLHT